MSGKVIPLDAGPRCPVHKVFLEYSEEHPPPEWTCPRVGCLIGMFDGGPD